MGPRNLIAAVLLGTALAAGLFTALRLSSSADTPPVTATVLPQPVELPAVMLLDQRGRAVDQTVFEGQWDLVFFGFTHCPDVCPLTLQLLRSVRRNLAAEGHEPLPRIVLVSVDPERDTPEALARYVGHFGDGVIGLTGTLAEIEKLTGKLGVYFGKVPLAGDAYTMDHYAGILLVDPEGRFAALWGAPHEAGALARDLRVLTGRG